MDSQARENSDEGGSKDLAQVGCQGRKGKLLGFRKGVAGSLLGLYVFRGKKGKFG